MIRKIFAVTVFVAASAFCGLSAFADFIEIKDRGILDGKIVSKDAESITFRLSDGKTERFSRKDVIYLDDTIENTGAVQFKGDLKEKLQHVIQMAKEFWEKIGAWFSQKTALPARPSGGWDS